MADIKIKYATKEDAKELAAVIATVIQNTPYYNELAKETEIKKFGSEKLARNIEKDMYSAIVAIHENKIVGFCLSRFDDSLIWVQWIGILPNCRSKNVSYLLLSEVEKTAAPRGAHKIWGDCRPVNKAAIHILTKLGWKQLVTIPNHWYGEDSILWEKPITNVISLSVGIQPTVYQSYGSGDRYAFA